MSYLCYRNMAPCVLDLPGVIVHYKLYTRGRGDAGSFAQRYGPMSNCTYSLVFTHLNVFFKHGHFEEGAILLSPWAGAILIRVILYLQVLDQNKKVYKSFFFIIERFEFNEA